MQYWYRWLSIILSSFPFLGHPAQEPVKIPVVYGDQNVERMAADLQRLEKFVYRTMGPDRLNHPVQSNPSTDTQGPSQPQVELFQSKLETLSQELPALIGRLEELEHQSQKLLENNKMFVEYLTHLKQEVETLSLKNKALEEQVAAKEKKENSEIPSLPPLKTEKKPAVEQKPEPKGFSSLSIEELEKKAKAALVSGQHDEAQRLFEALLEKDLSVEQEITIRFYLGEIWFLKKQHGKASDQYLKAYQKDPKGAKAPKSLLKVALSLKALGKKKEACITLKKLLKDHPKAESTVLSMAKEKHLEFCGA